MGRYFVQINNISKFNIKIKEMEKLDDQYEIQNNLDLHELFNILITMNSCVIKNTSRDNCLLNKQRKQQSKLRRRKKATRDKKRALLPKREDEYMYQVRI